MSTLTRIKHLQLLIASVLLLISNHNYVFVNSFTLVMMGTRRGKKGNLKRTLDPAAYDSSTSSPKSADIMNSGKGQEITGVSLPPDGKLKGWEFGNKFTLACANVDNTFYAVQGACPRCAFDLWKGDLITDKESGFKELPRVACPTCMVTYSMRTGKPGPPIKRTGLAGFVGKLAKQATVTDSSKTATCYSILRDDDGRVYCREGQS